MAKRSELGEFARGFGLLSDGTRLGILKTIAAGPRNVAALCKVLRVKQPTISHHLGLLRMGGLAISTRKGKSVIYTIDRAYMKQLAAGIVKLTPRK